MLIGLHNLHSKVQHIKWETSDQRLLAGDDDDFGDVPLSPSTDEDEGPLVALPDEDPFATDAPASQDQGKKQKAQKQKKRRLEAPSTAEDSSIAVVSTPACYHVSLCLCRQCGD